MAFKNHNGVKIILGIDPGLADLGFGIIENRGRGIKTIGYGSLKTKASQPLEKRLKEIYLDLNRLIKRYQPTIMAIEQLFFCKNLKTAIAVAQARGVAILAASQNRLPIKEFTPLQIKSALTGYGAATKNQIQQMVKIILKLRQIPKPDDAADALACAICCSQTKSFK